MWVRSDSASAAPTSRRVSSSAMLVNVGVERQVGPPPGRPAEDLEVGQGQLPDQLGDQPAALFGGIELVSVFCEHAPNRGDLVIGDGRHCVLGQLLDQVGEEQVLVRPAAVNGAAGHPGLPDQLLQADVVEADGQAGTGQGLKRGIEQTSLGLLLAEAPGTAGQAARGLGRAAAGIAALGIRCFKFDTVSLP